MAEKTKTATTTAKPRKPAARKKATPSNVTEITVGREQMTVARVEHSGDLRPPQREAPQRAVAAALLRIAAADVDDQAVLRERGRPVDDVQDLAPLGPFGGALPRHRLHRIPQRPEMLLPREWPIRGTEEPDRRARRLVIARLAIRDLVEVEPVVVLERGRAGRGSAVRAEQIPKAIARGHAGTATDITLESYPIGRARANACGRGGVTSARGRGGRSTATPPPPG